ncbi:hypothetical protein RD792_013398 [Penstemon davidsonii]|uniref:Uncharacterized protein n=1 Tax=Penstemon davidsonii TaxID=160366 RepID=A0ABR0CTD7_9LAMI|nr:hypothetical protein RD792_013398 [Penstemon davidsonii]
MASEAGGAAEADGGAQKKAARIRVSGRIDGGGARANGSSLGQCGANVDTDASPSNVKKLIGIADEMLKQKNVESVLFSGKRIGEQSNLEKVEWFAEQLVLEHQRRSCRIAPTVAFKQPITTTPNKS